MIVLNKKKKSWEMYPIGSPKGALNNKRTPKFIGVLKFTKDSDGLHINRFVVKDDKEDKLYPPSKAISFLKSQAVFLAQKDEDLEKFLSKNNIKIRFTNICQHCSYEGEITIVNDSFSYTYHDQIICKLCAEETIKRELELRGYSKKVFRNFKKVLEKTGSLDEVLNMLSPKFNPVNNPNLTLFDQIKVHDSKIPKIPMKRLKVPKEFKNVIIKNKNQFLLPVQYLAIREGLLRNENLLVVSATGSGKTLIGELAGVPKALKGKKFVFLTPLVALANQKYRDFKAKYEPLGLKVAIKVGMNRIKAKGELKLPDSNIADADIIVGTYEGIDFLLRSGKSHLLNDLGLILIDEIHTISDEDRGLRLNGLIKRIENIFPKTQVIGLSATIKNPKTLAQDFNMKLVQYKERPVPLERHIAFVRGESQRRNIMRQLVKNEFYTTSSKGFHGQTLIFTNSRRKTHKLANFLSNKGINASAYHAGLSYFKKERIEKDFAKGKIAAVVTTAALAAGVDFPASQVIFESLLMGNKWISPNEFSQMLGRAGRPSYHDRGVIYLVPEIGSEFDGEEEESVALDLLESDVENIDVDYTEEGTLEQLLADISSKSLKNIGEVNEFYKNIPVPIDLNTAVNELYDKKAIHIDNLDNLHSTTFGNAVSMSFLSVEDGEIIRKSLENDYYLSQYIKKPFFKNALKSLHKVSNKIESKNKEISKHNKKVQDKLDSLKLENKSNNKNSNKSNKRNKSKIKSNDSSKNGSKNKSNKDSNDGSKNGSKNKFNKDSKNNKMNIPKKKRLKHNPFKDIHEKMSKKEVNSNMILKVQSIAMDLEMFENAYIAPIVHKQIVAALKMNFSTRLFSESALDIISSGESIAKVDKKFQDSLLKLQIDFLRCDCAERPFCDCLQRGISFYILNQRLNGRDPIDISKNLLKTYQIQAYPGDIFSWLDSYIRSLDAIKRVASAFGEKEVVKAANNLIKIIEKG
ncbi:MAG: DUF5814 domain-containing protein [archaeon]|nr:DUF5814 domain-containing protein [archaeon]